MPSLIGKGSRFQRQARIETRVPSASMADIAFLLLIFFMVSTAFRLKTGLRIEYPAAGSTEKIEERRRDIVHLWIDPQGNAFIDDMRIPTEDIARRIQPVLHERPHLVVSVRADRRTPFREIGKAIDQLRMAEAVRVNFATVPERGNRVAKR